jgi:hypothetical protein
VQARGGQQRPDRSVAVFSSRERADVLERTVRAAFRASAGRSTTVDVLVNGNAGLAHDIRARIGDVAAQHGVHTRVWFIALADKAHAFNEYVHRLWPGSVIGYFIDGYARPDAGAFAAIERALDEDRYPLAATGVPTQGRSAGSLRASMLGGGGIHGNLYALRSEVIDEIRTSGCKLPLGLYRTDAMVGAWLAFALDPARHEWDLRRVKVVADANWDFDTLSIRRPRDLAAHARRWMRQQQGRLENRAVSDFLAVRRLHPRMLPATMTELVTAWLAADRRRARAFFLQHPLSYVMLDAVSKPRDWSAASIAPRLLGTAR